MPCTESHTVAENVPVTVQVITTLELAAPIWETSPLDELEIDPLTSVW